MVIFLPASLLIYHRSKHEEASNSNAAFSRVAIVIPAKDVDLKTEETHNG